MAQLRQEAVELRVEVARLRQALASAHADPAEPMSDHAALLRSEDRLRAIVKSAVDYAIITADLEGRITGWNSGATRLLGWKREDVLGRPCRLIFTPEDCEAGVPEAEIRKAMAEGRAVDERWHIKLDGTRFWGAGELMPLRDNGLLGTLKILRDRTEQRRAEEGLRGSEERYRLIVESARDHAIFTTDLEGRITSWNRGASEVLGWDEAAAIGRPSAIMYTPEDHTAGVPDAELAEALAEGRSEHDRWHLRVDGSRIWGTEVVTPLLNENGEANGFLKILRDRTAQRHEEEQRLLLLDELNHRVKNTLAIVQSLVIQTARGGAMPDALRNTLEARLHALAAAHDLLTRETWRGAELADVVQATLAPFDGAALRVRAHGPRLRLLPNAALVLNMALHELATNAVKYGALSTPDGYVEIAWHLAHPANGTSGAVLDLLWSERGGPEVVQPTLRGFGSQLVEGGVSYQLGGSVQLRFDPAGVECRFLIPLPSAREEA